MASFYLGMLFLNAMYDVIDFASHKYVAKNINAVRQLNDNVDDFYNRE